MKWNYHEKTRGWDKNACWVHKWKHNGDKVMKEEIELSRNDKTINLLF